MRCQSSFGAYRYDEDYGAVALDSRRRLSGAQASQNCFCWVHFTRRVVSRSIVGVPERDSGRGECLISGRKRDAHESESTQLSGR